MLSVVPLSVTVIWSSPASAVMESAPEYALMVSLPLVPVRLSGPVVPKVLTSRKLTDDVPPLMRRSILAAVTEVPLLSRTSK